MRYLTVNGDLSGTGLVDSLEGWSVELAEVGLSPALVETISKWTGKYDHAHYASFEDEVVVAELDSEGVEICLLVRKELPDAKIGYYSCARAQTLFGSFAAGNSAT